MAQLIVPCDPIPADIDYGSNEAAFRQIVGRIGRLTIGEVDLLKREYSLNGTAALGRVVSGMHPQAWRARRGAYAIARSVAPWNLPWGARCALRDAAAATLLVEAMDGEDFDEISRPWRVSVDLGLGARQDPRLAGDFPDTWAPPVPLATLQRVELQAQRVAERRWARDEARTREDERQQILAAGERLRTPIQVTVHSVREDSSGAHGWGRTTDGKVIQFGCRPRQARMFQAQIRRGIAPIADVLPRDVFAIDGDYEWPRVRYFLSEVLREEPDWSRVRRLPKPTRDS